MLIECDRLYAFIEAITNYLIILTSFERIDFLYRLIDKLTEKLGW